MSTFPHHNSHGRKHNIANIDKHRKLFLDIKPNASSHGDTNTRALKRWKLYTQSSML